MICGLLLLLKPHTLLIVCPLVVKDAIKKKINKLSSTSIKMFMTGVQRYYIPHSFPQQLQCWNPQHCQFLCKYWWNLFITKELMSCVFKKIHGKYMENKVWTCQKSLLLHSVYMYICAYACPPSSRNNVLHA